MRVRRALLPLLGMVALVATAFSAQGREAPPPASVVTAARIAFGVLWLHEGYVKYHAGFGRSDILLVVQSASSNSRPSPR